MPILPLTNAVDIYRYSGELLKHMPKDSLKTIQNDLLYSKEKVVIYSDNNDRRAYYTKQTRQRKIESMKISQTE